MNALRVIRDRPIAMAASWLLLAAAIAATSAGPAAAGDRANARAQTCAASACLALTINEEAVARWRKGRPAKALPISGLMGSFKGGDRNVPVTLLLAVYQDGALVDWTTRPPTVSRIGQRGFRADGVRPLVRPGGPAARELPAFALKHIGAEATLQLAAPVPSVADATGWWLPAAHFRDGPPKRLAAFGPDAGHSWQSAQRTLLIALVPTEPAGMADAVGTPWVTGTAPLFFHTP